MGDTFDVELHAVRMVAAAALITACAVGIDEDADPEDVRIMAHRYVAAAWEGSRRAAGLV